MKRILLLAVAFVFALGANAQEYVTEIEVLKGEKWWGLDYEGSLLQPLVAPFGNIVNTSAKGCGCKPILVSNAGRYIYSDNSIKIDIDNEKITIISEFEKVEVQKGGKTLREAYVVCALKNLKPGQSPDPEMFALPVYETHYDFQYTHCEDVIVGYAEKLLAEGFPPGIIVIGDGWQKVNGPYEFDPELYPDPKRMVDRLHALGFKVMLTVTPNVPQWGSVYGAAKRDGLVSNNGVAGILDMGNEGQFARLREGFEKIKATCGFDGFRFDWESRVGGSEFKKNMMSLGEGQDMVQYSEILDRPYAPYLSSLPNYNLQNGKTKDNLKLSAAERIISVELTAGLMGYPYAQAQIWAIRDIIKESQRMMADYLLLQCGMPVVSVDFAPWGITDPKLYEGVKAALNFRASLADYMVKLVEDSRRTGEPLVRHMEYQYPKCGFFDCSDQFMLGPNYLFAPCVDGADKRMVRFPKGTWTDRNGVKIRGPVVKEVDCSTGGLIYFEASR